MTTSMVIAVPSLENIQAFLKDVTLQLNAEPPSSTSAIIYNDRMYLPIRFIGEKLNADIHWDDFSNTVSIQSSHVFKDFSEANPLENENFIYGEILAIDKMRNRITIEEHYDDRDTYIEPNLQVKEDVIIILQRNDKQMNLVFSDLRVGDHIGLVLDKGQQVRGIILNQ
jgi:hypothetical protein